MKSYTLHYRNKYPMGHVQATENAVDVYDHAGDHCVALRKNGAGQWRDESADQGCLDKHDLAPIPKDARLYKEEIKDGAATGRIIKDEKYDERRSKVEQFLDDSGRFVVSCEDLKTKGFDFDEKQKVTREPKAKQLAEFEKLSQ